MNTVKESLRLVVEKWLGPTNTMPVRIARFGRMSSNQRRYVCVEASQSAGAVAIYFFLHDDGMWRVFPPAVNRMAMSVSSYAA
jgi:hypothetical protein